MNKVSFILLLLFACHTSSAQKFEWAKKISGPDDELARFMAVDKAHNIYTIGRFINTVNFDPGLGLYQLTAQMVNDIFIQKLDSAGDLVWTKQLTGDANELGNCIALDDSGNIYVLGTFSSRIDCDPGLAKYQFTVSSGSFFVEKLTNNGDFVWAKKVSGTGSDVGGYALTLDKSNNIYITGGFIGTADFDPGSSVFNLTSSTGGLYDVFVEKLDANGNFVWAKQMSGTGNDNGHSITVDGQANVYVTGAFQNTVDFDPGTSLFNLTASGYDVFVSKLDSSGNFKWANQINGSYADEGIQVVTDHDNNIYITGYVEGVVDFDPGPSTYMLTAKGRDIFLEKLDTAGNFIWAKMLGGKYNDYGKAITVDIADNVYLGGQLFDTLNITVGTTPMTLVSNGSTDDFVLKLNKNGDYIWVYEIGGTGTDDLLNIQVDDDTNVYTTGVFYNTVDFNPAIGLYDLTALGKTDIFIQKISQKVSTTNVDNAENTICNVYPNPSIGEFTISTDQSIVELVVTDISGKTIFQQSPYKKRATINIDIAGTYFLKTVTPLNTSITKIVVQN